KKVRRWSMKFCGMIPALMTAVPMTGDEGMGGAIVLVIVGVVLACAFVCLTILQKKRRRNQNDDEQ
ncbi:MAG: hypothetical protein ACI3XM_10290, partial [Eubacteriales bacterium]